MYGCLMGESVFWQASLCVRFSEFSVLYDDYYEVEEEDKKNITKWARSYFSDLREIKSYLEKDPDVKDKVEDWHKE